MKTVKILCLAAALVISVSHFTGCADSSSDTKSKTDSSSSQSESSSQQANDSSEGSEAKKPNAIGYDVKTSKRLYDNLKEKYGSKGYSMSMKSAANVNSEIFLTVKGDKVSNTNKTQESNRTMVFTGGDKATIYDHSKKSITEQKVDNAKAFVTKSDLLFGLAGDFLQASVDEQNDVINAYYKIRSDVTGSEGTICFCFKGANGNFLQITIQYDGQNYPILFGINSLKECDEKDFDVKELYKEYKKE